MQSSLMLDVQGLWLTADERAILRQPEVCGVILFARNVDNPKQVAELCRSIRAVRSDLLISVDQEGGRVRRLRRGFAPLPSMRSVAATSDAVKTAQLAGWLMAADVMSVGIDFSFAPVLDLDYGRNEVIADRSFGQKAEQVVDLGRAFMQGMRKAGMASVGKHFPGHGWVEADSHFAVPVDDRSLSEIERTDLRVFTQLSAEMTAVMPAHVIYPQVDEKPAGFSTVWLQTILRTQLGFKGLIFSDDLCMAGAHVAGDMQARTMAAVQAGCDILLVCNDPAGAEQSLMTLQQHSVEPCNRTGLMRAKKTLFADFKSQPDYAQARQLVEALV